MILKRYLSAVLLAAIIIVPGIAAADTTTLAPSNSTDWDLWILSGIFGAILFLASLNSRTSYLEVEQDIIISMMAWAPIAHCAYASFNVIRPIAAGISTLYSFPVTGLLMIAFLLLAIFNTLRLVALHRSLKGQLEE